MSIEKPFMKKRTIALLAALWLLLVVALIALIGAYVFFGNSGYRSDRLFILYNDEQNGRSALMVQLTKYGLMPLVDHYQYKIVLLADNAETYAKQYEYDAIVAPFKTDDSIIKFDNPNNENILSEGLALTAKAGGKIFNIDLKNMAGDFLINNSLNRLTYVNMGTTTIAVDGKEYAADFSLNKTLSVDKKFIYNQAIGSRGAAVFFSDATGGLYYADVSDVPDNSTNYISHAWALRKQGQTLNKDVGENVTLTANNDGKMTIGISSFGGASAELNTAKQYYSNRLFYDLLNGTLTDNGGTRAINGTSLYYDTSK